MFEISKIQLEQKDPKVMALMGMSVLGQSPCSNNHDFNEVAIRIPNEVRFKQLNEIQKLFKPHEIIIHLDPVKGIFQDCNISLLFRKHQTPRIFCNIRDYLNEEPVKPETSLE
ncbi:MAG: hypothetical protein GKS07_10355 [Nitrosopumilus sp.]|nr:MAG: hypothetical protein GKS07_10355 [Nitrosopumilus sp.]